MSDHKLDTDIEPERQRLKDTAGINTQDAEILGYGTMYTVGAEWNVIVPREWLLERIDDLDIPGWLAPSKVHSHYAYDRTIKRMRESWLDDFSVPLARLDDPSQTEPHRVTVDLKKGDSPRVWHVRGEVFYPESESNEEGGHWQQHELGKFHYNSEFQSFEPNRIIGRDHALDQVWLDVSNTGIDMHEEMQEVHVAHEIREMMYKSATQYTDTVIKLRRSVYMFPAGMGDFVESMAQLYSEINDNFKRRGEPIAIRTFEILDTDEKRDWIEHRVQKKLEENVQSIVTEGMERFDEGDAADQIVDIMRDNLSGNDDTVELYNNLLETELAIADVLEDYKNDIANSDMRDIVEEVSSDISGN